MEEYTETILVPYFTKRNECFITGIRKQGNKTGLKYEWQKLMKELNLFRVTIHPDGDAPENCGYISIALDTFGFIHNIPYRLTLLQCTVSVVDSEGEARFAKSIGMKAKQITEERGREWDFLPPLKVERFIRRRILLDSHEELLPEDTLTLRFDIVWWYDSKHEETQNRDYWHNIYKIAAKEESWFIESKLPGGSWLLDLRNVDSHLCAGLREKCEFFEALFRWPCKEMKDGYMPIHRSQYDDFFNLLCYIRFENLQHIGTVWEYCDLYEMANKYGVLELKDICSDFLKQNLTYGCAIETLRAAGLCCDAELRTVAFRLALSSWKDVRNCQGGLFADFSEIKELVRAAKILNLERETGDTLCDLAARQVLLNREKLQLIPTWSVFESEMPDLSKVILSLNDENKLDLDENKPAGELKEPTFSYDFYK